VCAYPDPLHHLCGVARSLKSIKKTKYLLGAAIAFSVVGPKFLRNAGYEEVRVLLLDIEGIGPWSASLVMVRGLGRMEELPTGDQALLISASWAYENAVDEAELRKLALRYGDWKG